MVIYFKCLEEWESKEINYNVVLKRVIIEIWIKCYKNKKEWNNQFCLGGFRKILLYQIFIYCGGGCCVRDEEGNGGEIRIKDVRIFCKRGVCVFWYKGENQFYLN